MPWLFALRTLKDMKKTPSSPAPSPPLLHTAVQSSTTPPGTAPLGARCREPTAPKQRGLRNGIEAWRLEFTCKRRPEKSEADKEGGSSRPSTILDGSQQRAAVISLPGAASILPRCRSCASRHISCRPASSRSPRPENAVCRPQSPAPDPQKKPALLQTEIPTAILPTASGSDRWSTTARRESTRTLQIWPERSAASLPA